MPLISFFGAGEIFELILDRLRDHQSSGALPWAGQGRGLHQSRVAVSAGCSLFPDAVGAQIKIAKYCLAPRIGLPPAPLTSRTATLLYSLSTPISRTAPPSHLQYCPPLPMPSPPVLPRPTPPRPATVPPPPGPAGGHPVSRSLSRPRGTMDRGKRGGGGGWARIQCHNHRHTLRTTEGRVNY